MPFGEYMPLRGLLEALGAPTNLVPRDANAGTGPAVLDSPDRPARRGRSRGRSSSATSPATPSSTAARVLLNPTNGSSYTGTILQTQQVASSRLRALETGRWVVQVAPTGFSAFVTPGGHVLDRTGVSEQAVRIRDVELREGRTPYVRLGDWPVLAARRGHARRLARAEPARPLKPARRRQTSSSTVTGPSLTSSTAISVRNRPVATTAPSRP